MTGAAVTVVVPVRDRAELLCRTLDSVAAQSVAPSEVLVADDGSTDSSADVAERYGARVLSNPGGGWGAAGARNAALAAATTPLVLFADSDDLLHPQAIERLSAALTGAPSAPFAFGRALIAREVAGRWRAEGVIAVTPRELEDPLGALVVRNFVPSSGVLARADALRAVGGYDAALTFSEDHDLWLRLARRGAPAHVPEVVCLYRIHTGNRHRAGDAFADEEAIAHRVADVPQAGRRLAERRGRRALELATEGRPGALTAVRLLARGPQRLRAAREAGRHWRDRRRWAAAGPALLRDDAGLRAWLEAQAGG